MQCFLLIYIYYPNHFSLFFNSYHLKVAGTKEDEKEEWEGRKGGARRKRRVGQEKEKGEEETEEEDNDDYDGEEKEFLAYKYIVNVLLQNLFDKAHTVVIFLYTRKLENPFLILCFVMHL